MRTSRIAWLAGSVAFLTAAGAGIAVAATTDPLGLTVSAGAATPAIAQTNDVGALTFTYDEETAAYATAGAVTIQNTGTREASYRLALHPHDATVAGLPGEVTASVGSVADVASCTTAASLTNPQSQALSTDFTYDSAPIPIKLAAGASVVLCVQTVFDDSDIETYGSTSFQLDLTAQLVYAAGASWTVAGTTATVTQDVVTEDLALLFENPVGRYWIHNGYYTGETFTSLGQVCKYTTSPNSPGRLGGNCYDYQNQWRLVPAAGYPGEWNILEAINSYTQPTTPAWTYNGIGSVVNDNAIANSANQRWKIEGRGDGTYRLVSSAAVDGGGNPICVTVTTSNVWYAPNTDPPLRMTVNTCNNALTTQGFRFTLIGYPVPTTVKDGGGVQLYPNGYQLNCPGNDYYRELTWTETYVGGSGNDYNQETKYRLVYLTQDLPGPQSQAAVTWFYNSGTWRDIQIHNNNGVDGGTSTNMNHKTNMEAWWQSVYGNTTGTHTVTAWVEQQITALGGWTLTTQSRQLTIQRTGVESFLVGCV